MNLAAALGAIVYAVQKFVGTPIASYYGIREARVLIEEYRRTGGAVAKAKTEQKAGAEKTDEAPAKPNFFESHKKYYGVFVSLAITAFFAWVAFVLGKWTGLASSIWALILGTLVSATGMLPKNILKHSNSSGIFNVFIFATIIPSLAQIRLEDLSTLAYALVVLFVVTCAVLYLFFYVLPSGSFSVRETLPWAFPWASFSGSRRPTSSSTKWRKPSAKTKPKCSTSPTI